MLKFGELCADAGEWESGCNKLPGGVGAFCGDDMSSCDGFTDWFLD